MTKKAKEKLLAQIIPQDYQIYGIFDFEKKELIYIHLNEEQVELEFELSAYDNKRFDIVEVNVRLI